MIAFSRSCIFYFSIVLLVIINIFLSDCIINKFPNSKMTNLSILDENYRKMDLADIDIEHLDEAAKECNMDKYDLLITALYNDLAICKDVRWDVNYLLKLRNNLIKEYDDFEIMRNVTQNILEEMEYFPVAKSINNKSFVNYENSWYYQRTYGGNRLHEGCDIMASINKPGVYPVVSVCDGIVEKKGWLEKGGNRVGVRSDNGTYYYYAHLSEYADIEVGDRIYAGDLLGFMGDSGYGSIGTTGQFDVHLHFGIYINDLSGNEVSINPYWLLLKNNKVLYFDY